MKKGLIASIIVFVAAAAGIILAVAKFMKRGSKKLSEDLDYNDDAYLEDDYDSEDIAAMAGPEIDEPVAFEETDAAEPAEVSADDEDKA